MRTKSCEIKYFSFKTSLARLVFMIKIYVQVLKALTVLIKNVPKQMSEWLPQILPPVWSTLTNSGNG